MLPRFAFVIFNLRYFLVFLNVTFKMQSVFPASVNTEVTRGGVDCTLGQPSAFIISVLLYLYMPPSQTHVHAQVHVCLTVFPWLQPHRLLSSQQHDQMSSWERASPCPGSLSQQLSVH